MATRIDDLWTEFKKMEPKAALGGILARKRGYHNSRDHLPKDDYSVAQFAIDREGPADQGSAIDITFRDAQAGDYRTIAKYSRRLLAAGRAKDPRTRYMREFFGNADTDREVEGWDFSKNRAASSDSSHLWHIHISIHRKFINDPLMVDAVLSLLSGESLESWLASLVDEDEKPVDNGSNVGNGGNKPSTPPAKPKPPVIPKWPFGPNDYYRRLAEPEFRSGLKTWQLQMKRRGWDITADGYFGEETEKIVRLFQKEKGLGVDGLIGPATWYAAWTARITD